MTAVIFNIMRSSMHDGDGLRTVVYFKGCPLRCRWCHNPESYFAKPEILYRPSRCIGCRRCEKICPEHHIFKEGKMSYIRRDCALCLKCAKECPNAALVVCGERMTVDSIFGEILKDKDYYDKTSGGVTLSGGECLLNPEFCRQLLDKCKSAGIHTAIETSLSVPKEAIEAILSSVDTFIVDLKHMDSSIHKKYTDHDNKLIISNIRTLSYAHPDIRIRIPLIPGTNDGENIRQTALFINSLGSGVKRVELLKYNNMARGKLAALGLAENDFVNLLPQDDNIMTAAHLELKSILKHNIDVLTF